ncbi:hypothetical protein EU510_02025 [Pseudoalteromonas sp. FUC4]|uniref:hypothetical protein n=1 Tax=unclassified Pseudoalteromonas TaxID=194690 RepID=UPI0011F189CB|nr:MULTISPECIES: hypothetical protein [unclassified Pseudoalteromonas]KAA1154910.1 hypothetical protein EU510_02025 [Pseudoalteromonas sp. FUC4]MBQ4799874.1 hypothetical protein [Pseudoalteromonas sp. MMG006]QQM63015.1 hypothetical protein JG479_09575 [Pseudoalteromonas sp. LC2018020214]
MKNQVIQLSEVKKENVATEQFLNLLDADIKAGNVKKIPDSVFDRIAAIKHKALVARQNNELIEM